MNDMCSLFFKVQNLYQQRMLRYFYRYFPTVQCMFHTLHKRMFVIHIVYIVSYVVIMILTSYSRIPNLCEFTQPMAQQRRMEQKKAGTHNQLHT